MPRARRIALPLALLLAALGSAAGRAPDATLYVGGPILTVDAEDRVVEALAVSGDRIAAVGDAAALRAWADAEGAEIVDLQGRAIAPGFIDAHGHFPGPGVYALVADLNSPPVGPVETIADLVAALRAQAEGTRQGRWVVGIGYDDTLIYEGRHPTRDDLDAISTRHPVAAFHVSGHLAALNSRGLAEMDIDAGTPDPEGGHIRRRADGRTPDGVLEETASEAVQRLLVPGLRDGLRVVSDAVDRYARDGITTAQSGLTPEGLVGSFAWLSRLGRLPIRLVVWPDERAAERLLAGEWRPPRTDPLRMKIGAFKLIADGAIQGYTAHLTAPYAVPPGDDPGYRGEPRIEPEDLTDLAVRLHAAGHQLAIHANGDAAIDHTLDALDAAQRATSRPDARHVIIHAQTARDDQLERMAALGAIPSFFVLHTYYWGDRHRDVFLGPERAARISPTAGADARGIPFTMHADAPIVPMAPLDLIWAAANRQTRSGEVLGPDQRIPPARALRAVTIDAARQHFTEAETGSLEPGKLADFVVLSRSPLDGDPATIREIQVLETVVGGETIWRDRP